MNYRRFGRTGWMVSDIGYGMWGMAGWTGSEDQESLQSLQRSIDLDCNFFDTAWAYGDGHSETLLRQTLRQNQGKRLYAATKIPPKNRVWPAKPEFSLEDCYPPEYIEEYVHRSLENIGVESIDLIQFHTWNDSWLQDERWAKKIADLRSQGLLQAVGISLNRWEPWNGVQTVRSGLVDAVQVVYNIFDQNPEDELFPACREMDVAIIARVPFDEGSLTGTLTADSHWPKDDFRTAYFFPENLRSSLERVERLKADLPQGMSLPDAALRFILSSPDVSTVIPGMRKLNHVDSNIAASDAGPLPAELLEKLRAHRWVRMPNQVA
ncbi:MAG: aldo/keto reductase [Chloroflexi bacterium]|nr:aldo/keto reductase [Chloroflexota bacterium]